MNESQSVTKDPILIALVYLDNLGNISTALSSNPRTNQRGTRKTAECCAKYNDISLILNVSSDISFFWI